ncbi:Blp family class II bacteriocin [Streptococcus halichoeri]|uniref:Blp family class II bacteriocin n=1 Tax=Streptococcus halichoeri TaxID=254785 RepID=UPI001357A41B|nr:Blp family class II bacteriocin [Streptococcus halichoeri]
MNTKAFEQFDVMNEVELSTVGGGNKCVNAIFGGALTGAGSGFVGGMATLGVTSIPGAFVGAHIGAIAGGLYCVGASL